MCNLVQIESVQSGHLCNLVQIESVQSGHMCNLVQIESVQSGHLCNLVQIESVQSGHLCGLIRLKTLQKKALEEDALNLIAKYLKNYETDERLCNMVLLTIASLTDSDEVKDLLAQTDLCKQLIKMAQVTLGENAEYSEDNQQKVKMSSDLLILLLTGEKSMEILFDGGKGEIFSESMTWLDNEHCQFLVEQGVIKRLLRLLKPVYGEQKCTLEHASLSALPGNKASLIKEGVIDAVLVLCRLRNVSRYIQMLGVLRMLVDGQDDAAVKLGQHREFVTRLVEWSACEEHPGVK
ncbi:rap1 GTPase-GDP dissociation stimulator 1-like, partial [Ruditapes philippinarum]|uniref:rap1 GTPase-GDP dissociation stimulator 1-like n=1 Tax=Ruditapes philippinarum TaxID=129788 RepID=UPI00295A685D